MAKSTAARTMSMLRKKGWVVALVEKYNVHSRKRHDLFGFADVIGMHPEHGILLVQVTSGQHVNARIKKMYNEAFKNVEIAIEAPNVNVEVHGWRKVKTCTHCGLQRYGKNRECECTGKHGTREKYIPIIVPVDLNTLYSIGGSIE